MYYRDFDIAFACNATHNEILRTVYFIFLHMAAYHIHKLLTVTFSLSQPYSGYVRQLVDGNGIRSGHCFKRWILKYDVWWQFQFLGYLLAQIFQY